MMSNTIDLLVNLTPLIPLSLKGGGESSFLKGLHPSLTLCISLNTEGV